MKLHKIMVALAAVALGGAVAAAQGTTSKAKNQPAAPATSHAASGSAATSAKSAVRQVTGSIVSAEASKLTLSRSVKGKMEEITFVITPETQKSGNLENGAATTVRYRVENGQNVAESIHAKAAAKPARKGM